MRTRLWLGVPLACVLYALYAFSVSYSEPLSLAAYYQCWGRLRAVAGVLQRFRAVYPEAPLHMVNDGGDRALGALARRFGARYAYAVNRTSNASSAMYFTSVRAGAEYVERIRRASSDCDWLLLLEDDVWVLGPIPLSDLRCDLNGGYPGLHLDARLRRAIGATHAELPYAGQGGSLLRCRFFRQFASAALPSLFAAARDGRLASDELLSALTYANGGSICAYDSYAEPTFVTFPLRYYAIGGISVLHQVKWLYGAER